MTAWEQRKLGGLFFESNERSSSMEILSVSVAKGIYPASESNRDTNPGASLANYKVVHKGDVVYNSMRMWQGAVGSSDYDGIVSPAYVVARPIIELDSTCFGYLLKRPEMLYKYLCDSQGNSKDTQTLKYNRFADIEVTMPVNLEEQRVISACLGRVDTLITLHQRKCQYRSLYGYLSWEQRKLGELMDVTSVRRVRQEDWTDEGVRFLRARDLVAFAKNEAIEDPLFISDEMYREYSAQSGKVVVGDLLVTGVGTIGVPWLVTSENPVYFKDGNIIWFKNQNAIDGEFFYHSFTAHAIQSYIKEAAGIGTVGTYTIETGKKTPIWLPLEREQRQIAAFMTSLDTLITLHQ